MLPTKPHIKKALTHSPRGEAVLANIVGYLIQVTHVTAPGAEPTRVEARVQSPGQCVAALRTAKISNVRCLVYALGIVYGEECLELVDEDFLLSKMFNPPATGPEPVAEIDASFLAGLQRGGNAR